MRFISVKIRCRFSKQLKTESLARQIDKRGFIKKTAATYSPTVTQYHRRDEA